MKSKMIYIITAILFITFINFPNTKAKAAESPFTDIENHWGKSFIINTYNKGIIQGYPGNLFVPDGLITRAEMAVIIVKAMALDPAVNPALDYSDVSSIPPWAAGYIKVAANTGIIKGYPDGSFRPDNKISRAEISVMAVRAAGIINPEAKETYFSDNNQIPDWAKPFVAKAYDLFILKGVNQNGGVYFLPDNNATRAEACVIIDKLCISNDQIAPTVPTVLVQSITDNTISLTWPASRDINGVSGYRIFRDNVLIFDTDQTTYTDNKPYIETGKDYTYEISAYDNSGNISAKSQAVTVHFDTQVTLYNIYSGESKVVYNVDIGKYADYVIGSAQINIYSRINGMQSVCQAQDLKSQVNNGWVSYNTQVTMYDLTNNMATVLAQDIGTKLEAGWTWDKRTPVEEAWRVPNAPVINGPGSLDKIITDYISTINNEFIPDTTKPDNTIRKGSAGRYYDAATAQGCLPAKYATVPVDRNKSIALITADLSWNQDKVNKLWDECRTMSTSYNTVIDPRLLMAVIMQEGTGSFDTNVSPSSPLGGGYIQPDFDADLSKAFDNHILGKIWAYSNYAAQFKSAAQANQGKQFTVPVDNASPPHTKVITYNGKGDLFEYTNNNVPRIRYSASTSQYIVSYGVYAEDYNWCNNIRTIYENMAGSGNAGGYSSFLAANPIPWPAGVKKPAGTFILSNLGTESTGKYSGYPMLNFVPST